MQVVLQTPTELVVHDGRWHMVVLGALFAALGGGVMWLRLTHPTGWSGNGGPWVVYVVGTMFVLASGLIFWLSADRQYVVDRTARSVALVVQRLVHRQSTLLSFKDIADVALEESAGMATTGSNSRSGPTYRVVFLMKDGSRVPWTPYSTNDRVSQETCAAAVRMFGGWGGSAAEQAQPTTPTPALISHPVATNWGCVAALLSIFVAVGLGIFSVSVYRIATWRPVPANVVSSDVGTVQGSKGNTYKPVVVYNYRYEGRPYQAATVTPVDFSAGRGWAQSIVNKYRAGDVTTAYVDPANPYKAYLIRKVSWFALLFVLIPVCFGLIFGWIVRTQRLQVALAQKHLVPVVGSV
ncbi:MAG TPA: DUF3592 domain-containing protein [Gemmatimonadaceae bacterium]|jgi:hypothetical protein